MLVGGIACRYEKPPAGAPAGAATRLYIMTLGVLAPYRGRGVGQRLLLRALAEALREGSASEVYLHVQVRAGAGVDVTHVCGEQRRLFGSGVRAVRCADISRCARASHTRQVNNDEAIAFYKKFGFEARTRTHTHAPMPHAPGSHTQLLTHHFTHTRIASRRVLRRIFRSRRRLLATTSASTRQTATSCPARCEAGSCLRVCWRCRRTTQRTARWTRRKGEKGRRE
jgi:GNAT superfamily N-acetyltransferase